jgi:hypothetical protein
MQLRGVAQFLVIHRLLLLLLVVVLADKTLPVVVVVDRVGVRVKLLLRAEGQEQVGLVTLQLFLPHKEITEEIQ